MRLKNSLTTIHRKTKKITVILHVIKKIMLLYVHLQGAIPYGRKAPVKIESRSFSSPKYNILKIRGAVAEILVGRGGGGGGAPPPPPPLNFRH
jgi:hypothetical protein